MGIAEFFRTINWIATLQVAFIRIGMASLLWIIIMLITGGIANANAFFGVLITLLVMLTIAMAVAIPVIGLAKAGIPLVGLLALPAWLVVIGDPAVHMLWKIKPEWIPVDQFKLINPPVLAIFTIDENNGREVTPPARDSEEAQKVYEQGLQMFKDGQTREALEAFVRATEIDPNCVDACVALARSFLTMDGQKYSDEAFFYGEQAYSADPNDPKARNVASSANFEKGKMAWDTENWDGAVRYFKRAYELEPKAETLSALGYCAEKANMLADFADVCDKRLKQQPDDHPVKYILGRSYAKMAIDGSSAPDMAWIRTERLRRAEVQLMDYLATDSLNGHANYWLGIVYFMTDRLDEASHIVAKLQKIDLDMSKELEEFLAG